MVERGGRQGVPGGGAEPGRKQGFCSLLGPGVHCKGELQGSGDICVQGSIVGNLEFAGTITIDPGGRVVGDLWAQNIIIGGTVQGNLRARELTTLCPSGHLEGDVETGRFVVADGAVFNGRVYMTPTRPEDREISREPAALAQTIPPQATEAPRPSRPGEVEGMGTRAEPSIAQRKIISGLRGWLYLAIAALAVLLLLLRLKGI